MKIDKQLKIVVLVGMFGCFLTSTAGVTAVMIAKGWDSQGGFQEWWLRLRVSYSAAVCVVVLVFPLVIPRLTAYLDLLFISSRKE